MIHSRWPSYIIMALRISSLPLWRSPAPSLSCWRSMLRLPWSSFSFCHWWLFTRCISIKRWIGRYAAARRESVISMRKLKIRLQASEWSNHLPTKTLKKASSPTQTIVLSPAAETAIKVRRTFPADWLHSHNSLPSQLSSLAASLLFTLPWI